MPIIDDAFSGMQASISRFVSGSTTPPNNISAAGALEITETLEGFAQRRRGRPATSDYRLDGAVHEVARARFEDRELLKSIQTLAH